MAKLDAEIHQKILGTSPTHILQEAMDKTLGLTSLAKLDAEIHQKILGTSPTHILQEAMDKALGLTSLAKLDAEIHQKILGTSPTHILQEAMDKALGLTSLGKLDAEIHQKILGASSVQNLQKAMNKTLGLTSLGNLNSAMHQSILGTSPTQKIQEAIIRDLESTQLTQSIQAMLGTNAAKNLIDGLKISAKSIRNTVHNNSKAKPRVDISNNNVETIEISEELENIANRLIENPNNFKSEITKLCRENSNKSSNSKKALKFAIILFFNILTSFSVNIYSTCFYYLYIRPIVETPASAKDKCRTTLKVCNILPQDIRVSVRVSKLEHAKVRQSPRNKSPVVFILQAGQTVTVIKKKKKWLLVSLESTPNQQQGWIKSKYLRRPKH